MVVHSTAAGERAKKTSPNSAEIEQKQEVIHHAMSAGVLHRAASDEKEDEASKRDNPRPDKPTQCFTDTTLGITML